VRQAHVVILNGFQERFEIKAWHQHDCRAAVEAHVQDDYESVDMKQRQHADECVGFVKIAEPFHLAQVRDQVVMRQHHAFW
jgi:hypothetical protein